MKMETAHFGLGNTINKNIIREDTDAINCHISIDDSQYNGSTYKEIVDLLSELHEYRGKQELYMESYPDVLEAMARVAKIQSTGASNRIEGIYTSEKQLGELVNEKTEPKNRNEEEIVGYREVFVTVHTPKSRKIIKSTKNL